MLDSIMKHIIVIIFIMIGYVNTIVNVAKRIHFSKEEAWQAMLMAETRNRHYTSIGNVQLSHKGAIGIAQVMPCTVDFYNMKNGTRYRTSDAYDKEINLKIGRWYRDWLWSREKDKIMAINYYNVGHNSKKFNTNYVSDVFNFMYRNIPDPIFKQIIRKKKDRNKGNK